MKIYKKYAGISRSIMCNILAFSYVVFGILVCILLSTRAAHNIGQRTIYLAHIVVHTPDQIQERV